MVYDLARDLFARIQRRSLRVHARRPSASRWSASPATAGRCTPSSTSSSSPRCTSRSRGRAAARHGRAEPDADARRGVIVAADGRCRRCVRPAGARRRQPQAGGRRLAQSHVQQTLAGITVVQAFGQEERQRRASRSSRGTRCARRCGSSSSAASTARLRASSEVGGGAVLLIGAHQVIDGALTTGGLRGVHGLRRDVCRASSPA